MTIRIIMYNNYRSRREICTLDPAIPSVGNATCTVFVSCLPQPLGGRGDTSNAKVAPSNVCVGSDTLTVHPFFSSSINTSASSDVMRTEVMDGARHAGGMRTCPPSGCQKTIMATACRTSCTAVMVVSLCMMVIGDVIASSKNALASDRPGKML